VKSSGYLDELLDDKGVVRRDLPEAGPAANLATPLNVVEADALATRLHSSARKFSLLRISRPSQPQSPKLVSSADVAFSVRAPDAYVVSTASDNETFFIEPLSFLRYADAVISDYSTGWRAGSALSIASRSTWRAGDRDRMSSLPRVSREESQGASSLGGLSAGERCRGAS
jgi:hypothetical protein